MRESWLRPNYRVLALGLVLPALWLIVGAATLLAMRGETHVLLRLLGWSSVVIAALACVAILLLMRTPRIAYQDGELLLFLRSGGPIRVPIEVVECFFLGQGPSMLASGDRDGETSNIVVRLAEAAKQWQQVAVKPALGRWCEGYITIRGTWCEPIDGDLLRQLNRRLTEVQRQRRSHAGSDA